MTNTTIMKYLQYVQQFHGDSKLEIDFIKNNLKKHLSDHQEDQTEIEHILDYLFANPDKDISKIGYETVKKKAEKWDKKLQSLASKDDEVEGEDYEVVHDFGDGYRFVKLLSESAYNREGKLMSHCVASYYGRDIAIYSLRDANNNPHCTIEENNQVKGKGNQTVDNKYFTYCIQFLEQLGCEMGENEMKNIGYYKLDDIDHGLSVDSQYLYDGKYISEKNIDKIKDSSGGQYYGFGLWKIKKIFTFDVNMNVKFNFDIEKVKEYFIGSLQKLAGGNGSQLAGGNGSQLAGGNGSQLAGGNGSQLAGGYDSQLVGGNYSQLAGGNESQLVGGNHSQLAGSSSSQLAGGYYSTLAGGYYSQLAGGSHSQLAGGYESQLAGGYDSQLAGGNHSQLVGGNHSQLAVGRGSIAVGGHGSTVMGDLGSALGLVESDERGNVKNAKLVIVDGEKIKAHTRYKLEGGEFIEVIE